jgi:hypothetical protein
MLDLLVIKYTRIIRVFKLKSDMLGKLQGRIEMTGRRGRRRKQLLDKGKEKILEIERGSIRSHPVENSLWKRLRTYRKTGYRMNECIRILNIWVVGDMTPSRLEFSFRLLEGAFCLN